MKDDELTDDMILEDLRHDVKRAKEKIKKIRNAAEWEKELENMINANSTEQPEYLTDGESELWDRIMAEPKRKRVPRAWWGWILPIGKWFKNRSMRLKMSLWGILWFVIVYSMTVWYIS